jgi:hypothetical protein
MTLTTPHSMQKSQNTIPILKMQQMASINHNVTPFSFIHSKGIIYTFGTSIVGTAVVVLVAGALNPAWSECFL